MNSSAKNIFNIADPQAYWCTVWSYRVNHSLLLMRADKHEFGNEIFYLTFVGVLYFEGPLKWKGADFCIGTTDECIKLLQGRGLNDVPEDALLNHFRLFVVELPDLEQVVKILAHKNAIKTTDIPPNFPWLVKPSTD